MGESFEALALPVRQFHRLSGRHELHGWVETDAPASFCARLIARCLGTPMTAGSGPIRFELDAQPRSEVWTRHFPSQAMTSQLGLSGSLLVERLGMARLTFDLSQREGKLVMRLRRLHFLGVPCPMRLMPRVMAHEFGQANRLHFSVHAALPIVGAVVGYCGHLVIPAKEPSR